MFRPTQRYNIVATLFRMVTTLFQYCNDVKVKNDHRSKFSNLSNWKEEAWKKSGLQRDSNPWPPRYRCVALPTELWSHTLGARSIYWVHISREEWNDVKYIWNNDNYFIYTIIIISYIILLHEKFLQFDWLRAVVFQLNLKNLHVKITNLAGSSINN